MRCERPICCLGTLTQNGVFSRRAGADRILIGVKKLRTVQSGKKKSQ